MRDPPSLRNNNGSLEVRVRIDGRDAFINRLGHWSDPAEVAKAKAISAQIWSPIQERYPSQANDENVPELPNDLKPPDCLMNHSKHYDSRGFTVCTNAIANSSVARSRDQIAA